jgi:hypothetical protein
MFRVSMVYGPTIKIGAYKALIFRPLAIPDELIRGSLSYSYY